MPSQYSDSVFINCPFDRPYKKLFDAMVFAVHDSGFIARCALEVDDSATNRLSQIYRIIEECKYGIHDISRTQLHRTHRLPRFNMPFELGLFLGCQAFGQKKQREKCCLVTDSQRYRYQKFISDIAGNDIRAHNNSPQTAVRAVRNWLRTASGRQSIPGPITMWNRFLRFQKDVPAISKELRLDVRELIFVDYTNVIAYWLQENAT